ncbi:hypothetical protein E1A91_A12G219700v1 [Gossypium mustelinum]|uniref:Disease resistance R13L4/SHOC-2-like LRR domain-containing protein n=1 Tax=Gossypium mustelinum TaxID=34275 RepID=A0A5D2WXD1_GOSMU|nr:hypothetical protein E1A91_A12G219700v1 [Gossypium mustelinum]
MSSTDDKPPPLSIQDINNIITNLKNLLTSDCAEAEITVATNTAANSPTGNEQDGSNRTGNEQDGTNKQDGDANQAQETNDKKKEPLYELGKLCKELDYMIRSFQNLENLKNSLTEPFKTLEANVNDIVSDLEKDELRKQVQHNLRVFRNNITRVKILILLQLQAASINSDGNRALQTTFATGEAGDLPYLYRQPIFENSYYFKEIEEKYESLDDRQKLCLLCFSIFPENAEIKKRFLRFWWVGENLIPQNGNDEMGDLNDTLTTFVKKRLIEPVLKKNRLQPRSYKVTPIVRSCLIHFAKKARFFDYDPDGKPIMDFSSCNKACMVKSERATASWFADYLKGNDKDGNSEKPKEQQQHQEQGKLSADLVKLQMLFNFLNKEKLISASQQIDKLQTLFNLSKQFPDLPTEWFSKMTGIKVLYLGRWEATAGQARHIEVEDIEFLKGFKNMKNLRLLSLQGISGIPKLPATLCKLENLRILDLRACHDLEKLPERIGSLKKLTYLDLSECYLLDYIPQQLNKLSELQVLKGFVILDAKNSCTLDDLSELSSLRKLSVNVNTTKFNIDEAGNALAKFQKLEKLRIAWGWGGMPGKEDSTLDSSSEQQQSKTKKKQASSISSAAAKASTDKVNKGEEKGNWERSAVAAAGEANSKTAKLGGGLRGTANIALMAKKWRRLSMKGREPQNLEGLERLVKLDLQCFPRSEPPTWLVPRKMKKLTNLSIRGGRLGYLNHKDGQKWNVDTLRLKFLVNFKMNWKEMQQRFPNLKYLENLRCPRITFCPCDANGVWQKFVQSK